MSAFIWALFTELERYIAISFMLGAFTVLLCIFFIEGLKEGELSAIIILPLIILGIFGSLYSLHLYFKKKKKIEEYNNYYYNSPRPPRRDQS